MRDPTSPGPWVFRGFGPRIEGFCALGALGALRFRASGFVGFRILKDWDRVPEATP